MLETKCSTDKLRRFNRVQRAHKGLLRRYEGPMPIIARVGKVSYKLQLPHWLRNIHPVWNASSLKPYHADQEDPARSTSTRPSPHVTVMPEREVEQVLADRRVSSTLGKRPQYLVKWKNLPDAEASWERAETLLPFAEKIEEFLSEKATRTSAA